jgi:hypothetical protein
MTKKEPNRLIVIIFRTIIIIFLIEVIFLLGLFAGRNQSEEWKSTKVHQEQRLDGYSYCPYCGEYLKDDE